MNILLTSADAKSRLRLNLLLEQQGHAVASFNSPAPALDHFAKHRAPVVIVEGGDGESDTRELCSKVRTLAPPTETYLILVATEPFADDLRDLLDCGVDDVLAGPVRSADIRARLIIATRTLQERQAKSRPSSRLLEGTAPTESEATPDPWVRADLLAGRPQPASQLRESIAEAHRAGSRLAVIKARLVNRTAQASPFAPGQVLDRLSLRLPETPCGGRPAADRPDRSDDPTAASGPRASEITDLPARLAAAVQNRQFQVHYQPIIAANTGRVAGFEALLRWRDDSTQGWVAPACFLPLAESNGLIVEIGRQIATQAFEQLAAWRAAGQTVGISLNVSKRALLEPSFCEETRELARAHGLNPEWVTIEVTEAQSLLHNPACRRILRKLSTAGFRLSLDDFGTGQSAFDLVAELPFREVKIDMSVVRMGRSARGRYILQAILEMCRTLHLESVLEGVENAVLASSLRRIGATRLQGYWYAAPLPPEAVSAYLEAPAGTVACPA